MLATKKVHGGVSRSILSLNLILRGIDPGFLSLRAGSTAVLSSLCHMVQRADGGREAGQQVPAMEDHIDLISWQGRPEDGNRMVTG